MEDKLENLSLNRHNKMSAMDAVAQLSEITGYDDQQLLAKMPFLKDYKGTVMLTVTSKENNKKRVIVMLLGLKGKSYAIDSTGPDSEPEITELPEKGEEAAA